MPEKKKTPAEAAVSTETGALEKEGNQNAFKDPADNAGSGAKTGKAVEASPNDGKGELRAKGIKVLESYPKEEKAYVTADGFVFFGISDATNHAATLRDKAIITVNRGEK